MSTDKATHFREMVDKMDDQKFARWIDHIAHLKLRHPCDCESADQVEDADH
jgi:hypothetical protein